MFCVRHLFIQLYLLIEWLSMADGKNIIVPVEFFLAVLFSPFVWIEFPFVCDCTGNKRHQEANSCVLRSLYYCLVSKSNFYL